MQWCCLPVHQSNPCLPYMRTERSGLQACMPPHRVEQLRLCWLSLLPRSGGGVCATSRLPVVSHR